MKYYKIINNNEFIGIACSNNFIKYSPIAKCFLRSNEVRGEYININDTLYRDAWMAPIRKLEDYIDVMVLEIEKDEYDIINETLAKNETIIIDDDDDDEPIVVPVEDDDPDYTLEFVRSSKLLEMSQACRRAIEEGFDLEIRGETHHFSLTIQDQLNLMSLGATMQADSLIPYHADGEETAFYSANEINQIIAAAQAHKDYQTTYYNSLKAYINSLDTIEAIAAITYGTPIPDEYKSDVLMVLE